MADLLRWGLNVPMGVFYGVLKVAVGKAKKRAMRVSPSAKMLTQVKTSVGSKVWVTTHVPPDLELDFLQHRSETYLKPMTFGVAKELSSFLRGGGDAEPTTARALVDFALKGAGANACRYDKSAEAYVAEFDSFHFDPWPSCRLEVSKFVFTEDLESLEIHGKDGVVHRPGGKTWQAALDQVNATFTIGIPTAMHNWVHFSLLEAVAEQTYQHLPRSSVLSQLLAPHVRFTNRINQQALWVRKSTEAKDTAKGKLVPWHPFPMNGKEFADGVLINTGNFYGDLSFLEKPDQIDVSIPYYRFLRDYFEVIERFVKDVAKHVDKRELSALMSGLGQYYPGIEDKDPVRVLSMSIWLAGVYHCVDHASYADFAGRYGLNRVKSLAEPKKGEGQSRYERFRLRCFLNIFGGFNANPDLNQNLTNISAYGFEPGSRPSQAADRFLRELRDVDREHGLSGTRVLAVDEMVQSVCF